MLMNNVGFLLGWIGDLDTHLGLLPHVRDKGPHLW